MHTWRYQKESALHARVRVKYRQVTRLSQYLNFHALKKRSNRGTQIPEKKQNAQNNGIVPKSFELGRENTKKNQIGGWTWLVHTCNMSMAKLEAIQPPSYYVLLLQIMSKRRTWVCVFVIVYGLLFTCSWNFLKSMISWYELQAESSASWWPALYASVVLGAVFGLLSMVAALAVVVPVVVVTWIAIVVLLAFFGKPKKTLVVEGRKITREIFGFVMRVLLKEGNIVAAVCAVLGYFALGRTSGKGDVSLVADFDQGVG